jgi:hypothetical protein
MGVTGVLQGCYRNGFLDFVLACRLVVVREVRVPVHLCSGSVDGVLQKCSRDVPGDVPGKLRRCHGERKRGDVKGRGGGGGGGGGEKKGS